MSQPHIVPLDKKRHADLSFKPLEDYRFTSSLTALPLLAFEVVDAARCFPIVFAPGASAAPHALLGLGDANMFVDGEGRWTASYLPLYAANHPFSLLPVRGPEQPDAPEVILAIEEDAPHFRQADGQPLYGPDGEPTALLNRISATLGNQHRRFQESAQSLAELALSGVLGERVVTVRSGDTARAVKGLRVADRDRVMALSDAMLARWARNGLLEMLFAHWQSLRCLNTLLGDPSRPASAVESAKPLVQ